MDCDVIDADLHLHAGADLHADPFPVSVPVEHPLSYFLADEESDTKPDAKRDADENCDGNADENCDTDTDEDLDADKYVNAHEYGNSDTLGESNMRCDESVAHDCRK